MEQPVTFQGGRLSLLWSAGDGVLQGVDINLICGCHLECTCRHTYDNFSSLSVHAFTQDCKSRTLFTMSPGTTMRVVSGATFISLVGPLMFLGATTTR